MFIHVRPEETEALRRIPKPLLFAAPGAPKGHLLLGFNERGECPMLREGRCSIYEHRPQTCRDFDCRVFAASGILPAEEGPQGEIARRARSWRFDLESQEDREHYDAVQAAGLFLREQSHAFPPETLPRTPVQLALMAVAIYEIFAALGLAPAAKPNVSEIAREVLAFMERRGADSASKQARRSSRTS
nr:Flagellin N-methylase [uncultured bacterium]AIA14446.1 Flagellin N-methylase [uncultured bacterium]AIA14819.1 Flagellin N-methylase [uncultured bacterium]